MALNELPTELVIHILQFLPGEDVSRFKQLSQFYKEINRKYKNILPRPIIEFHVRDWILKDRLVLSVEHNRHEWKYLTPLILPEVEVEEEKEEKPNNNSGKLRNFCRLVLSKLKRGNRSKSCSCCLNELAKESEPVVDYKDFFSTFTNNNPSELNLLEIFEFVLEKGDIEYVNMNSLDSVRCTSLLAEAINNTSGRVLRIFSEASQTTSDLLVLLRAIGNQKYSTKMYPSMHFWFSSREKDTEKEQFWPQAGLLNTLASIYSDAMLSFSDIDVGIIQIAEMWSDQGCPIIHFRPEVKTPWFFTEWDIKKFLLCRIGLEVSLDNRKQALLFKDKGRGKILRFDKIFTTKRGIHDRFTHSYYLYLTVKVYDEY